jgi:uncharacterized protein (TIGR00255 family)
MIRSMTGYARAESQGSWGRMSCELRSVNHRYLDLQIKVPDELRVIENDMRAMAAARISRGKVEIGLRFNRDAAGNNALDIDQERLSAVLTAVNAISVNLPASAPPDLLQLLAWPGVVRQDSLDWSAPTAAALGLFKDALGSFTEARQREGERLQHYLLERLDAMNTLVDAVRARAPLVRAAWLERLKGRFLELGMDIDPGRLAQEMTLAAQKLDVDEEMSRLLSHFIEVRDGLKRDEAVGRRLDFLMQELNREANTLSSKSQDAEMTRAAVEMKVIIEQMREQVQNIE